MSISSSIGLFALITLICGLMDLFISRKEKEAVRLALLRGWFYFDSIRVEEITRNAGERILECFDQVYGKTLLSWRGFWASCAISSSFILCVGLLFSGAIVERFHGDPKLKSTFVVFGSILLSLFINLPIDFLMLFKSRAIIRRARSSRLWRKIALCLLDVSTSYLVYSVIVAVALVLVADFRGMTKPTSVYEWTGTIAGLLLGCLTYPANAVKAVFGHGTHGVPALGMSLLSTLSTSTIFSVYVGFSLILAAFPTGKRRMMHLLENIFESKSLFTTAGALMSCAVLAIKALFWLMHRVAS